ncbi:MAG: LCP family protein [Anaerolineales bacterium]|nr:LCP family protein [Anaerolineales bacterium]
MGSTPTGSARKRSEKPNWLIRILAGAFIVGALVSVFLLYRTVKGMASSWTGAGLPSFNGTSGETGAATGDETTPTPVLLDELPDAWNGQERVTILLMGLDYRDWETGEGPARTDSMMLLTVDPISRTAGMLSIPRDLWVEVPLYGYGRINTAYFLGERDRLPGGGPALAVDTVENFLGIPIQYYVQIDFTAFERMIDELGGLEIEIMEDELRVDPIGPDNTVYLDSGVQTLSGPVALAYARARYTDQGDFDRANRQQEVALAIRDQILRLGMIPTLLQKAPLLYQELAAGINTNLGLEDMIALGLLALEIDVNEIYRGVISPPDMVTLETVTYGGAEAQVLKPIPSAIRELRDQIFAQTSAIGPSIEGEDGMEGAASEAARVAVLNGAGIEGLAGQTEEYLISLGLNVVEVGNADRMDYVTTMIIDYTGNPYTTRYLMTIMDLTQGQILYQTQADSDIDVVVIVGADFIPPLN